MRKSNRSRGKRRNPEAVTKVEIDGMECIFNCQGRPPQRKRVGTLKFILVSILCHWQLEQKCI